MEAVSQMLSKIFWISETKSWIWQSWTKVYSIPSEEDKSSHTPYYFRVRVLIRPRATLPQGSLKTRKHLFTKVGRFFGVLTSSAVSYAKFRIVISKAKVWGFASARARSTSSSKLNFLLSLTNYIVSASNPSVCSSFTKAMTLSRNSSVSLIGF